jgi:non-SMC mitotic condensation complex subunit 1
MRYPASHVDRLLQRARDFGVWAVELRLLCARCQAQACQAHSAAGPCRRVGAATRCGLVAALCDLMQRWPNTLERFTRDMYAPLADPEPAVREAAMSVLALLISKDMMKVKGNISKVCLRLLDPEPKVRTRAVLWCTSTCGQHCLNSCRCFHNLPCRAHCGHLQFRSTVTAIIGKRISRRRSQARTAGQAPRAAALRGAGKEGAAQRQQPHLRAHAGHPVTPLRGRVAASRELQGDHAAAAGLRREGQAGRQASRPDRGAARARGRRANRARRARLHLLRRAAQALGEGHPAAGGFVWPLGAPAARRGVRGDAAGAQQATMCKQVQIACPSGLAAHCVCIAFATSIQASHFCRRP